MKAGRIKKRSVQIVMPIELARNRALADALEYRSAIREWKAGEAAKVFNAKPYAERVRIYREAQRALLDFKVIRDLAKAGRRPRNTTERKRLVELSVIIAKCPRGKIDKRTMLARGRKR